MTATRPRNASQTRADILAAARRRFAAQGYERTTLAQEKANKQPDAGVIYSWPVGSIRKDLRRRTIQGQYVTVTKMGGYRRRHGQWSPAGHPAKYWLEADVTRAAGQYRVAPAGGTTPESW